MLPYSNKNGEESAMRQEIWEDKINGESRKSQHEIGGKKNARRQFYFFGVGHLYKYFLSFFLSFSYIDE